jgi:hypothetical protein
LAVPSLKYRRSKKQAITDGYLNLNGNGKNTGIAPQEEEKYGSIGIDQYL